MKNEFIIGNPIRTCEGIIPANEVLNINDNIYVSYTPAVKVGGHGFPMSTAVCIRNKNKSYNTILNLKGDWRTEFLNCNLDENKVLKLYYDNEEKYGIYTPTAEIESFIDDFLKNNPNINELFKIMNNRI